MKETSKIEVIVATMRQTDFSKIHEMNISSDVVFANQTNVTEFSEKAFGNHTAKMISTQTKGVGINRNFGLQYATGDILLLADDDMVYKDNYVKIINEAFSKLPDADAIIFNIETIGNDMGRRTNNKIKKIKIINGLNYGAVRIAVKRSSIIRNRISFSSCFGGGAIYSSGEDTLFICDMIRSGFKIYTYPATIAAVDQTQSSWFTGYNEKYIHDKGVFFYAAFGKNAWFMCLQDLIRHPKICKDSGLSLVQAFSLMRTGAESYNKLKAFNK